MNPNIERIQQWANQYETCAVNHVPGYLAPAFPEAWTLHEPLSATAKTHGECNLRFYMGSLDGSSVYGYSRKRPAFDDLDAYIDFNDLFVADETPSAFDIDLTEVL